MINPAVAEHAASDRPDRRALLGGGVLGAALALAGARPAAAGSTPGLPDGDLESLAFAISLELAARDLYDAAIAAGAEGRVWAIMREQHESYAQLLAGISGISANRRDDAAFAAFESGFTGPTSSAAFELENTAAATHFALLADVVDPDAAGGLASIAAMESRHAVVMAGLAGLDGDLDALFLNTATPLSPEA